MADKAEVLSRKDTSVKSKANSQMKSVLKDSVMAFLFRIGGAALTFFVNIVIARKFGAEGNGAYYIALTVTTIATMIGRLGLDNSLLRFIAANAAQKHWGKVNNVYKKGMLLSLGFSTALTVLLFALSPLMAEHVFKDPSVAVPLQLMSLSIVPLSLLNLSSESLKALKKTNIALFVQSLGSPLIFVVLLLMPISMDLNDVFLYYVVSQAAMFLMGIYFWNRVTKEFKKENGEFSTKFLIKESIPLFWVTSLNIFMNFTDTIMLSIWEDKSAVGIYGAALRVTMLASMLLFAVNSVVGPRFAAMWEKKDIKGLEKLGQFTTLLMVCAAILFTLPFILFPDFILNLFGDDFTQGSTALIILSLGQFFALATGPVAFLLMMTGNGKFHRNNVFISVVISVSLNAILIPIMGMTGAAIANSFSLVVKNILGVIFVKKKLNVSLLYSRKGHTEKEPIKYSS